MRKKNAGFPRFSPKISEAWRGVGRVLLQEVSLISGARKSSQLLWRLRLQGLGRLSTQCPVKTDSHWSSEFTILSGKVWESFIFIHSFVGLVRYFCRWWLSGFKIAVSGGSRICQRRGGGATSYYWARFLPKTAWKWKKLDRGVRP